jgi:hypothetical protein
MVGNIYYPHMRKSSGSPSRYKLYLQFAVRILVSDYMAFLFSYGERYARRRRRLSLADESIHIGIQSRETIAWDVSYLSLKVDDELKLNFYIRADCSVKNKGNQPELLGRVFRCSLRMEGDLLVFELAKQDGALIRHFWFDREIAQGVFHPVVVEIQKCIHSGKYRRNALLTEHSR